MPKAAPHVQANGDINATGLCQRLRPYLDSDGLDMSIARLPWLSWCPGLLVEVQARQCELLQLPHQRLRVYQDNGWQDQAVAYPVDEPTSTAAERHADALAAHAAQGQRPARLSGQVPAHRRSAPHEPRPPAAGQQVPLERRRHLVRCATTTSSVACRCCASCRPRAPRSGGIRYYNSSVAKLPNFVIDKSLADERVWGWLMYQWNVDGMLYWGVNRWGNARTGAGRPRPLQGPALVRVLRRARRQRRG